MQRRQRRWLARAVAFVCACLVVRLLVPWWCGRDADAWYRGDAESQRELAAELVAFEATDDAARVVPGNRFDGEWALVTHQMIALGLGQLCLAHPAWTP